MANRSGRFSSPGHGHGPHLEGQFYNSAVILPNYLPPMQTHVSQSLQVQSPFLHSQLHIPELTAATWTSLPSLTNCKTLNGHKTRNWIFLPGEEWHSASCCCFFSTIGNSQHCSKLTLQGIIAPVCQISTVNSMFIAHFWVNGVME